MFNADLADTALASHWPDPANDSLHDLLRDAIAPFLSAAQRERAFSAVDAVLAEVDLDSTLKGKADQMKVVFETLRAIYGDTRLPEDVRRKAVAAAIGANDPFFEKSYQHYADQFAVTRACIHSGARDVQRRFGVRARRDKKDPAREKSRAKATGPRQQRPAATSGVKVRSVRAMFSFFRGI